MVTRSLCLSARIASGMPHVHLLTLGKKPQSFYVLERRPNLCLRFSLQPLECRPEPRELLFCQALKDEMEEAYILTLL
jgi:hypothetical protein